MVSLSLLEIVARCDNFNPNYEHLVPLLLTPDPHSATIGLLRPIILNQLRQENQTKLSLGERPLFFFSDDNTSRTYVSLEAWLDTPEKRTLSIDELCKQWRDNGTFASVCGPSKWRNERYPVYKRPFGAHDHPQSSPTQDPTSLNYAFELERSCCAILGIVTYGVHMSIYQRNEHNDIAIWVPTRSGTKPTFPLALDNTVAGGIPSGMGVFESLIKECEEEASLPKDLIVEHAKCTGAISYFFTTSQGWLQPEIEYVYDILVPPHVDASLFTPRPSDGEVEQFELLDRSAVVDKMRQGLFKPNCAVVIIDLLIRLGYITPETEPDFMEILTRMHSRFSYESW